MKKLFTIFIFSLLVFTSKAQWVELNTGMENPPYFYDVYAITPDIVVVVGANGTILKTTDGGETWQQKPSSINQSLYNVQFPTSDIGYITGEGGVLKSIDGGETWSYIDVDNSNNFYSLSCVDENLIFISNNDKLFKSNDGGETWERIIAFPGGEVQFLSNNVGFLQGFSNSFYKTINGGLDWLELEYPAPFYFINENVGFIYDVGLLKTTDGGNNFEWLYDDGGWIELSDIYAIDENNVWGILAGALDGDGSTRGIAKITSSDTETYTETIAWDNSPLIDMSSIHFADDNTGYVVGKKNGISTIWKNGTGINDFPTETASTDEVSNNLFKIYPNPASKEINIEIQNSNRNDLSVSLTDMTGKNIYFHSFNNNKVKISTESFPKGTYILSVKTNNKLYNKKIIIN